MKSFPFGENWIVIEEEAREGAAEDPPERILHCLPTDDLDQHETSIDCWCQPSLDTKETDTGDEIILHRLIRKQLQ